MNSFFSKSLPCVAWIACAAAVGAAGPAGAATAADPGSGWVGTWKLDKSRSHLAGDTITYSKNANGFLHYSEGGPMHYDFAVDGKEYPAYSDRTITWTAVGDHAWDSVIKAKGAVLSKVHRELSADGKTLTITATGSKPDGSTFNEESLYTRVSGTQGLLGNWRSTKSDAGPPETFVVSAPAPGVLRWHLPDWQDTVEGEMDGSDLPVSGPRAAAGMTYSGKFEGVGKIRYSVKFGGEAATIGVETLAADGKSFTDVSYTPGKENEKFTAIYVKQ